LRRNERRAKDVYGAARDDLVDCRFGDPSDLGAMNREWLMDVLVTLVAMICVMSIIVWVIRMVTK
jgi:hypothetical protein